MDCARCGKPLAEGAHFCNYCGSFVQGEEPAQKPTFQLSDNMEPIITPPPEQYPQPYYGFAYPAIPQPAKKRLSGKMIALLSVLFVVFMGGLTVMCGILASRVVPKEKGVMEYYNESLSHYFDKQYEAAIEDLDHILELEEDFAGAYILRGRCHYELGNYELAVKDYDKAIDIDPDYSYTYLERARAYIELEDFIEAVMDCDKALELGFDAAVVYAARGEAHAGSEIYSIALSDCDKAIEILPREARFYVDRAGVYRDSGQYDPALADCNKALELDPGYANAYTERGITFHEMGQNDNAIADLERALELDPEDDEAREYLQKIGVPGY